MAQSRDLRKERREHTLWTTSQIPTSQTTMGNFVLNITSTIRVVADVGGGTACAVSLCRGSSSHVGVGQVGRPVKWVCERSEASGRPRP